MKFLSSIATYLKDEGVITFGTINDEAFIDKAPSGFNSGFIIFTETYKLQQENSFGNKKLSYQHRDCQIYVYGTGNDIASARQKAFSIYNKLRETNSINNNVLNTRIQQPTFINDLENNASCYLVEVQAEYVEQIDVPQQQTLQEQIDSLSWASLTVHLPTSSLLENQLTINDFVSFPTLPSGTLVKGITHHALTSGNNLDATINFSRGNELASKNVNILISDSMYFPNTYKIHSSDYNSITYSKSSNELANNDTITLNNSTFVDQIRLADNVEIQFTTSGTIRLSDNSKFLTIKYNDGNQYNYAFPNNVTPTYDFVAGHNYQIHSGSLISDLGAYGTRSITITESDYTSIDDDGTGPRFVGYTLRDTSTVFNEMIAYIKTNKTISHFTTFYDNGYDTVYSGGISSPTFNLVAGKTYQFEENKDPIEVVSTKIYTIKATEYTSIMYTGANNLRFIGLNSQAYETLNPTGSQYNLKTGEILDIEFNDNIDVISGDRYLNICKQSLSNKINIDLGVLTQPSFESGHKYRFEDGKLPVDLGTY